MLEFVEHFAAIGAVVTAAMIAALMYTDMLKDAIDMMKNEDDENNGN